MRLLREEDVIRVIDKHTSDDNRLDDDITCILEEVKSPWIKCVKGQMPEDLEENRNRKIIHVLVTTATGKVTKVQRECWESNNKILWSWGRIYGEPKA